MSFHLPVPRKTKPVSRKGISIETVPNGKTRQTLKEVFQIYLTIKTTIFNSYLTLKMLYIFLNIY